MLHESSVENLRALLEPLEDDFFQGFLFLSSYQKYVAESGDRVQERKWWTEWFEKSLFMTHRKL